MMPKEEIIASVRRLLASGKIDNHDDIEAIAYLSGLTKEELLRKEGQT